MPGFIKRFRDLGIEGSKARFYDEMTLSHRMGEIRRQALEVANQINEGDRVLEIAPGAGYLSIEIAKLGNYSITGLDISRDLVEICQKNALDAGVEIDFRQGNVAHIPFRTNEFNFIICVLAFKNFKSPAKALLEMYRVLKPGGTALIIDLNKEASLRETRAIAEKMGMRGFQALIAGAIQRKLAYSRQEFEDFIAQTDFKAFEIRETRLGFSINLEK